jgi:hypothetical protein
VVVGVVQQHLQPTGQLHTNGAIDCGLGLVIGQTLCEQDSKQQQFGSMWVRLVLHSDDKTCHHAQHLG